LSVVKEICKSKQLDDKVYPARNISFLISNAKNSLITPQSYASQAQNDFTKIVAEVFDKYEKRLHQLNALDFDDILLKTLTILKNPEILDKYQEKYKYLMVDEYQDTNAPQYNIVKLLASKYRNLAVV
jgi:DNA helicase-2/ATP-dependent DNA helicase PcrA